MPQSIQQKIREHDLFTRSLAGHEEALVELLSIYTGPLYRFTLHTVRHPAAAEWIVQQTCLTAIREASLLSSFSAFSTWLWSITAETCRNHLEARGATSERVKPGRPERFEDALQHLAPADRMAFLLHDVEGLSFEQVGWILEEHASDAKRRVHHARIALSATVAAEEEAAALPTPRRECAQA